jgi:hypothetical protein
VRLHAQKIAAAVFGLTCAALIPFWVVKGTEPSGHAALWVLYGVLAVSAVSWLVVTLGVRDHKAEVHPALRISSGTGPEFRRPTPIGALASEVEGVHPEDWGNPTGRSMTVLKVAETSDAWARGVRVRITECDPPPRLGRGSLPADLTWHGGASAICDIAPCGREYVMLVDTVFFENGSNVAKLPNIPDWHGMDTMDFTIEVFDSQRVLDRRRFRADNLTTGVPSVTELENAGVLGA